MGCGHTVPLDLKHFYWFLELAEFDWIFWLKKTFWMKKSFWLKRFLIEKIFPKGAFRNVTKTICFMHFLYVDFTCRKRFVLAGLRSGNAEISLNPASFSLGKQAFWKQGSHFAQNICFPMVLLHFQTGVLRIIMRISFQIAGFSPPTAGSWLIDENLFGWLNILLEPDLKIKRL